MSNLGKLAQLSMKAYMIRSEEDARAAGIVWTQC